ncbi:GPW/gp25 family protein [Pseudomonas sp. RIT-PI-S]|uniref:GPW/gp25 family protein n=1 Tax=Pseudomonas sp. RIT-PI-S TaxID=3035295 RepID=UPI0021D92A83|nr:GPW/gp25 family protein [Pseudomonas sp. RIT-PI-S]
MIGMSARTGRRIEGAEHLAQSIADILLTPVGSRLMRRDYGSLLLDLMDWPLNGHTRLQAYGAIAIALMRWEPRIRLARINMQLGEQPGQAILELDALRLDNNEPLNLRVPLNLGAAA